LRRVGEEVNRAESLRPHPTSRGKATGLLLVAYGQRISSARDTTAQRATSRHAGTRPRERKHSLTLPTAPVTLGALTIRTLGARPRSEWRRHALFEGELTLMKSRPSRRVSRRSFVRSAGLLAGGAWLAGCAPTTGGTAAPKPAAPAAGATSAPAAAARPAGGGPPLKIGVLLPYSGVYTTLGESITNAMQLYFDSVGNTAGGRTITLIKEDEGIQPDEALRKTRKLLDQDQVDLLTGVVSTAVAYALRDLVHDTKTIFICSNAGGNDLTRSRKS